MNDQLSTNAHCIEREIAWFRSVLNARFRAHAAGQEDDILAELPPPHLHAAHGPYASVIEELRMSPTERLVLMLAFLPEIRPDALDPFLIQNESLQRRFTEFGGTVNPSRGGFQPDCETALFLLAGGNIRDRLHHRQLFQPGHFFSQRLILRFETQPGDPPLSATLHVTPEYAERLTSGRAWSPPFSVEFPAQLLTTPSEWSDLVVNEATANDIGDIIAWVRHRDTLMNDWNLRARIRPGFRSLFCGPPGTGKTMTAALLGKATGLPVYRVDLSKVVSKYIGETEKNLASLFDRAEHGNWILFFDEADSLFGKRTETRNSNDRAANQQISYLLQRVEDFPGVVILASNLRSNIDEAFSRRFQSLIHFTVPDAEQRRRLWEDSFRDKPYRLAKDIRLADLARDYELTGGNIVNILRYACLKAVARQQPILHLEDILFAIRSERHKEGKSMQN